MSNLWSLWPFYKFPAWSPERAISLPNDSLRTVSPEMFATDCRRDCFSSRLLILYIYIRSFDY